MGNTENGRSNDVTTQSMASDAIIGVIWKWQTGKIDYELLERSIRNIVDRACLESIDSTTAST